MDVKKNTSWIHKKKPDHFFFVRINRCGIHKTDQCCVSGKYDKGEVEMSHSDDASIYSLVKKKKKINSALL